MIFWIKVLVMTLKFFVLDDQSSHHAVTFTNLILIKTAEQVFFGLIVGTPRTVPFVLLTSAIAMIAVIMIAIITTAIILLTTIAVITLILQVVGNLCIDKGSNFIPESVLRLRNHYPGTQPVRKTIERNDAFQTPTSFASP